MIVIDFEGFPHRCSSQQFVVKELVWVEFVHGETLITSHLYQAPYPFELMSRKQREVCQWLTQHRHGLDWSESGRRAYSCLADDVAQLQGPVFSKGLQKCKFLSRLLNQPVYDLDRLGFPRVSGIPCALAKAALLANRLRPCGYPGIKEVRCHKHRHFTGDDFSDTSAAGDSICHQCGGWRRIEGSTASASTGASSDSTLAQLLQHQASNGTSSDSFDRPEDGRSATESTTTATAACDRPAVSDWAADSVWSEQ
jgi:hypothetical protein